MSFPNSSSRRSGFGGGNGNGGNRGSNRPAAQAPSERRGGGGGNDRPRSAWTTAAALYDPYHSSLEAQVVTEFYRSGFGMKLAPVYAERRGPDDGATGRKYNHDAAAVVVLDLGECIVFRAQLEAFINGQLTEVVIPRGDTKRIVLCPATAYYDESHPEFAEHANGLALSVEQDASDNQEGSNVVFVSRQQAVKLSDTEDEVAFFPELQALLAVIDSFIQGVARLDFSSMRLLDRGAASSEDRAPASTAPQPARRTGGLGGAASTPAGGTPARGTAVRTATTSTGSVSPTVSDDDLDGALGGGDTSADAALDDVLGDAPQF